MTFKKISVCILDDSEIFYRFLKKQLDQDETIHTNTINVTEDTLKAIKILQPDIIVMGILPYQSKRLELLHTLGINFDIPVIVLTPETQFTVMVELGADACLAYPVMEEESRLFQLATLLKIKIKVLAGVHMKIGKKQNRLGACSRRIIAIGASMGGVEATLQLLQLLPVDIPGIVIVQHMPEGFTKSYAERLNRDTHFNVREAATGDIVQDGQVLIAGGGKHLRVCRFPRGFTVTCTAGEPVNGFCPSVDVLFDSVAKVAGKDAVGIILTGIGKDGAVGLKAMHDAGAHTWGQSKESCVVYGMPAAAKLAGAVDEELSLIKMGQRVGIYFKNYLSHKEG